MILNLRAGLEPIHTTTTEIYPPMPVQVPTPRAQADDRPVNLSYNWAMELSMTEETHVREHWFKFLHFANPLQQMPRAMISRACTTLPRTVRNPRLPSQ